MRLLQLSGFRIMTVDAQRRSCFRQMEIKLCLPDLPSFVCRVASIAPHIQRSMAAALLRDVLALVVAREAQIVLLLARRSFQQLILIL